MALYSEFFENPEVVWIASTLIFLLLTYTILEQVFRKNRGAAFIASLAIAGMGSWYIYRNNYSSPLLGTIVVGIVFMWGAFMLLNKVFKDKKKPSLIISTIIGIVAAWYVHNQELYGYGDSFALIFYILFGLTLLLLIGRFVRGVRFGSNHNVAHSLN